MSLVPESANRRIGPGAVALDAELSLQANFDRVVAVYADRPALGVGAWQASYAELDAAANRLAHVLMRRGAAGDRVAILMAHDSPLVAATVAAVKAGRIGMVLNPMDPGSRHRELLYDAQAHTIVTDAEHEARAAAAALPGSDIVAFDPIAMTGRADSPRNEFDSGDTAFLIYTSGSTGGPKAVMRTHRQVLHNALRQNGVMQISPESRLTLFASLSGAQGLSTVWFALLFGAALYPFPVIQRGFNGLAEFLQRNRITTYRSSASLFRQFTRTLADDVRFPHVRLVRLSSEPATSDDFKAFQKHFCEGCAFVHSLSGSETGNLALLRLAWSDRVPEGRLPLGKPSEGVEIFLVDEDGAPVGPGESGEIAVRSRYISAGYWRNPNLTAERFSDQEQGGTRLYRTGDMGRFNADGMLIHLGRKDALVKLRGYRVELAEIEAALARLPAIESAVVDLVERSGNEPRLVAYVVLRGGQLSTGGAIRRALRATLPSYMVPSAIEFLDRFPLSPHGKIDRERLRQSFTLRQQTKPEDTPRNETEAALTRIFAEVFELTEVGRTDDFFDLGGDSLVGAVIAAKISVALGVEIDLGLFIEHPTLAELAEVIEETRQDVRSAPPALVRAPRDRPLPLSLFQERVWMYAQSPATLASYTALPTLRLRGAIDRGILLDCMSYLANRHEILRTTFEAVNGQPVQVIHPHAPAELPFIDLSTTGDPEAELERIVQQQASEAFDLGRLPLLQFTLVKIGDDEYRLIRKSVQIITDGWSWNIYFSELQALYEARLRGEVPPLPETEPLQYADYAVWQRRVLDPEAAGYRAAIAWWKETLRDPPAPVVLPFQRPEPIAGVDPREGTWSRPEDAAVSQRLARIAQDNRATYYMVRMAAFLALLAAETAQPDQVIGTYVTNRTRVALQRLFGPFANLATIRIRCDERSSFPDWLAAVRRRLLETEARTEIPYELLRAEFQRDGIGLPEIRVLFDIETYHPAVRLGGAELTMLQRRWLRMPWGFTLRFRPTEPERGCEAFFDAGLYDGAGVAAFMDRLARLLEAIARSPEAAIAALVAESQLRQ
jgi:amino acid adenylation domain-containing protein